VKALPQPAIFEEYKFTRNNFLLVSQTNVGYEVGEGDGICVGDDVGSGVGSNDGGKEGVEVGALLGCGVGWNKGNMVGRDEGW
jgi:hypothetical protein